MEQSVSNNEPTNPNPKPHPLTALAFMEIGLFEIIFVITLLLIIFGTLNYFNILYVSETFPKYLGWLPSLRTNHAYTDKTNNQAYNDFLKEYYAPRKEVPSGTSRPTPTPVIETEKAKIILSGFVSSNLVSSVALSLKDMRFQKDTADNPDNNTFYANWSSETGTVSATLRLVPNTKDISSLSFSSVYKTDNPISLSLDNTEELSSKVFQTKPYGTWGCKTTVSSVYCENFGTNPNGVKIGVSVQQLSNAQKLYLGYCEFHKTAKPMYDFKSCSLKFSKEGV